MKTKLLVLLLFFSPVPALASNSTQVVFEGYYKMTLSGQPIGYNIQKHEFDSKKKQFLISYFIKTNKLGGDFQESIKAIANDKFEPIKYAYTGQVGGTLKTIDATFKSEAMTLTKIEGKTKKTETYKIPKGTFLSSYLPFLMLQKGISAGTKFSYSAVAEEDGDSYNGEAFIKENVEKLGLPCFRILNKFKGQNFVSFMSNKGEVLSVELENGKVISQLVKDPAEATQGFNVPASIMKEVFGSIPTGKINSLQKKDP